MMLAVLAASCQEKIEPDSTGKPDTEGTDSPSNGGSTDEEPSWPENQQGKSYIWDGESIPQITINISIPNWNYLLSSHDKNPVLSAFVSCDAIFDNEAVRDTVRLTGIRLCDNADGNRPEGTKGTSHSKTETTWNFFNFELDFDRYKEGRTLRNVKGMILKSCNNDPTYARERYCYELFHRYGIWIIGENNYCRVSIHVEGDDAPAYIGVYQMIEPIDPDYITDRSEWFEGEEGYIWKCTDGATLLTIGGTIGADNGNAEMKNYLLMNNQEELQSASAQLSDFITKLNALRDTQFKAWITSVCNVRLLLKTYAVITTAGMYDDYWNAGNNYFLYFNSKDPKKYKVFFVPYDFEKSLGTADPDVIYDTATVNPYVWGKNTLPLISKLLMHEEFRSIYTDALYELTLAEAYLFDYNYSIDAIRDLMYQVSFYTANDTGKYMNAKDLPVSWNSPKAYNLTKDDQMNFFKVRSEVIREAIGQ